MIEEFYLSDYRGESNAGSQAIVSGETVRLPDEACKFVMLSNWTVTDATNLDDPHGAATSSLPESAETGNELYYGFNGVIAAQLFPGQSTKLLPVKNLNQICVRTVTAKTGIVRYVWFW